MPNKDAILDQSDEDMEKLIQLKAVKNEISKQKKIVKEKEFFEQYPNAAKVIKRYRDNLNLNLKPSKPDSKPSKPDLKPLNYQLFNDLPSEPKPKPRSLHEILKGSRLL